MPGVGKKADAVADRSGVPLLYNPACLHQSSPPGGKGVSPFPDLSTRHRHLAGRVPRAKRLGRRRRNPGSRNLHTALIHVTCKFREPGFRLWRPRRFALGTRPARCRRRVLRAGKTGTVFPPGGGRLYCGQAGEYLSGTPLRSAQSLLFCRLQALPAPAAAGGHARNLQMLTI